MSPKSLTEPTPKVAPELGGVERSVFETELTEDRQQRPTSAVSSTGATRLTAASRPRQRGTGACTDPGRVRLANLLAPSADRVAQTVVKMVFEPGVESVFHRDSYGYRPGRSALDAVAVTRKRCWVFDWVVDLDIKAFFDSLDHALVERAVAHHTDVPWVRLYISRWLRAPVQMPDGALEPRTRGTPQGGVISPLWPTSFCTTRSTSGCGAPSRSAHSSATRMTGSFTVGVRRRPRRSWMPSGVGSRSAIWSCTPPRLDRVLPGRRPAREARPR